MSEPDLLTDQSTSIGTNAEYILPSEAKNQPPVLLSVSKAIIIETVKDLFGSILGFFLRYIRHFALCFVYFFNPSLQKKPFSKLDFKENSQHAFEFVMIVLAILIFLISVGWIPPSNRDLLDVYGNALSSKVVDVMLFIVFAVAYLLLAAVSILLGRFFRRIFRINTSVHESDILYVYLNNAFFSIAAVIALILRSAASQEVNDVDSIIQVLSMMVVPSIVIPLLLWGIRFPFLHKLGFNKGVLFFLLSVSLLSAFYCSAILIVCAAAVGL